ncbi:tripartite tricarboxylate transporter substrate binding protein [Variovorax sp. HJSM1_2]|uniref:tripartite tricarboxylate transporter substrate binding protein n=1 Tax=Variovorax sp. HJSM1_2 TaxID=3366263 RepID=UPI003BBA92E1
MKTTTQTRKFQSSTRWLSAALLAAVASTTVMAQAVDRPVRVILPISAGSGVDGIARAAAPALGKALGQPVVIDNLPGAGGLTGASALAKAAPDGMTLGILSNNHVINPSVFKKMPYDTLTDFTYISVVGSTPLVIVVNPAKVPARTAQELIALLKAKPDAYNYGSSGNGTILQLGIASFLDMAGVQARHIPYKGTGPMVTDLIGGQVDFGMVALPAIAGHLKSGALVAIGVGSKTRASAAPDIPTIAEQGLPGYEAEGWFTVAAPPKLPAAQVKRIHDAVVAAFAAPDVKEAMAKQSNTINPSTPEAATAQIKVEVVKYADLVKKSGLTAE